MLPTVLTNADIVLDDRVIRGSVVIKDGQIADVSDGISRAPGSVGLGGDLLIPGLIELHTDNIESHIQPRPNVDWPHAAAIMAHDGEFASVGATTVFDAMRLGIIEGGSGVNEAYARQLATKLWDLRAANALRISHFLHLRAEVCSATLMDELAEFGPNDRVVHLRIQKDGLGYQVFNAVNDTVVSLRADPRAGKAFFPHVPFTREVGEFEGLMSNAKIADVLGFKEEHDWRNYVTAS